MSFFGDVLSSVLNIRNITEPVFVKEFDKNNSQLNDLIELSQKVVSNKKEIILRDIHFLKYGLEGEKNVYYELKNSFIPMLCLHDIRLEYKEYTAQYDFIIITNKSIMVLETKKLNGDIEITADGDFIRIMKNSAGRMIKKEGMYSPVSQNERHVNILKEILVKEGLIKVMPVKSAVIISNPKTIVDKRKCPRSLQNHIYKYDQITTLLKRELNDKKNELDVLEKYMYGIAEFLVKNNKPITYDYYAKYSLTPEDFEKMEETPAVEDTRIYDALREYRLKVSREEGIKPYMLYNNKELELLVQCKPKSKQELAQISGFGEKKVEKYGDMIIAIINGAG